MNNLEYILHHNNVNDIKIIDNGEVHFGFMDGFNYYENIRYLKGFHIYHYQKDMEEGFELLYEYENK